VVVPGNPPLGCSPTMLTSRSGPNTTEYDPMGCLIDVNRVATVHNSRLRAAVVSLRGRYPRATIILADFYSPIIKILRNPSHYGKDSLVALVCTPIDLCFLRRGQPLSCLGILLQG
uniref:Uncharacterized protein n=1 Tax=Aegilops tauschii subsp. strangulata TaxID=200361 RepID=A0A453KU35_AEGTS